jgi:hypothetical protein
VTLRVIEAHGADLAAGAIIMAEAGRLRVRLPGNAGLTGRALRPALSALESMPRSRRCSCGPSPVRAVA